MAGGAYLPRAPTVSLSLKKGMMRVHNWIAALRTTKPKTRHQTRTKIAQRGTCYAQQETAQPEDDQAAKQKQTTKTNTGNGDKEGSKAESIGNKHRSAQNMRTAFTNAPQHTTNMQSRRTHKLQSSTQQEETRGWTREGDTVQTSKHTAQDSRKGTAFPNTRLEPERQHTHNISTRTSCRAARTSCRAKRQTEKAGQDTHTRQYRQNTHACPTRITRHEAM